MGIYLQHEDLEAVSFDHVEDPALLGQIARACTFPLALECMVPITGNQPERSWSRCLDDLFPCLVLFDFDWDPTVVEAYRLTAAGRSFGSRIAQKTW
jgi:hypothetical protein